MSEQISQAVIKRLPRYYRYLKEIEKRGEDRVSSFKMSEDMGLNASQIRRDLNCFGGFGQQGYGYSVEKLKKEIAHILGLDKRYNVIVVGAGRIGQALMGYDGFEKEAFHMQAIFDNDGGKVGMLVNGKPIMHTNDLSAYLKENKIDIAMLCIPKENAKQAAKFLADCGIKAIWNFAPIDVGEQNGVAVENVHLSDSLYVLSYKLDANQKRNENNDI